MDAAPDLKNKTILIAEDNDANFRYFETAIRPTGAQILRAGDGLETVAITGQHPGISIILMDGMMPGMTGYQAAKEIRKFNTTVPIILITAYVSAASIRETIDSGCNDYLAKPLGIVELYTVLEKWLAP